MKIRPIYKPHMHIEDVFTAFGFTMYYTQDSDRYGDARLFKNAALRLKGWYSMDEGAWALQYLNNRVVRAGSLDHGASRVLFDLLDSRAFMMNAK